MATKTTPKYSASIKIMGKTYKASGKTIEEALSKIDNQNAKGPGILTITKGKDSKERILPAPQVSRLFNLSPLMREIALKQVSQLFEL